MQTPGALSLVSVPMFSDSAKRISHMPFYATTVHSIIHILDFCGLFAIDVLF